MLEKKFQRFLTKKRKTKIENRVQKAQTQHQCVNDEVIVRSELTLGFFQRVEQLFAALTLRNSPGPAVLAMQGGQEQDLEGQPRVREEDQAPDPPGGTQRGDHQGQ